MPPKKRAGVPAKAAPPAKGASKTALATGAAAASRKAPAKPVKKAAAARGSKKKADELSDAEDEDDDEPADEDDEDEGDNAADPKAAEASDDRAAVLKHLQNMRAMMQSGVRHLSVGTVPTGSDGAQALLCREQQVNSILQFLASDAHPTLQLFGMPGTGKTAAVKNAVGRFAKQRIGMLASGAGAGGAANGGGALPDDMAAVADYSDIVSVIFFNGYVMQRPTDVFASLLRHLSRYRLTGAAAQQGGKIVPHQAAALLEKRFSQGWGPNRRYEDLPLCVIIIDEMDKCCEHSGKTLFRLVDWLTMPFAKCKMITIANAMQLPERLDPKTRSRLNTTQRVTFPSYSPEQLQHILKQRLDAAHAHPSVRSVPCRVMSPAAEQYICRQIGLHNGDVRRLLQTSAAALQDVLVCIDDFVEKVKAVAVVTMAETVLGLGALGLPTMEEAVTGVAQVKHLSNVARGVLHDRFQDFLNGITSPFVYTVILLIASESINQAALLRSELSTSQLPLDRLYLLVRATIDAHVKMESGAAPPSITMKQLLMCLESLRQVNFIELSVGESEATLRDATTATSISDTVYVTIVHPPQDIVARCEGHALFEAVGKNIIKRHQL